MRDRFRKQLDPQRIPEARIPEFSGAGYGHEISCTKTHEPGGGSSETQEACFPRYVKKGIAVEPPAMPLGLDIISPNSAELEPPSRMCIAVRVVHQPPS